MAEQQLVARIKRSSKYFDQAPPNTWFAVRVVEDDYYQLRGNNNNYRVADVVLGMRLSNGSVLDFSTGKTIAATKGDVMFEPPAKIYLRRNGAFGASCDDTEDTGHTILEDSGRFTVHSIHGDEPRICVNVSRAKAEQAIANDWRSA